MPKKPKSKQFRPQKRVRLKDSGRGTELCRREGGHSLPNPPNLPEVGVFLDHCYASRGNPEARSPGSGSPCSSNSSTKSVADDVSFSSYSLFSPVSPLLDTEMECEIESCNLDGPHQNAFDFPSLRTNKTEVLDNICSRNAQVPVLHHSMSSAAPLLMDMEIECEIESCNTERGNQSVIYLPAASTDTIEVVGCNSNNAQVPVSSCSMSTAVVSSLSDTDMESEVVNCNYVKEDRSASDVPSAACTATTELLDMISKTAQVLKDCMNILPQLLPKHWSAIHSDEDGLQVVKYSPGAAKVIQRSIHLSQNLDLMYYFHGKLLSESHQVYGSSKNFVARTFDAEQLSRDLCVLVNDYRLYEVCVGAPNRKFATVWRKDERCVVNENQFHEIRYSVTCRSKLCSYAVPQLKKQCGECSKVLKRFAAKAVFKEPADSTSAKVKTPNKNRPVKSLTTPQKAARLRRYKAVISNLKRQNKRLRDKVAKMIEDEAVTVSDDLDRELTESLYEGRKAGHVSPFHELFLQQQLLAARVKNAKSMRWHPLMIRFALQIKMLCGDSGYKAMAASGFIKLPGCSTLYDYSHVMNISEGCHAEIIEDVAKEIKSFPCAYQANHVLMFDEVNICQNLVQRKTTGEVVGYCNLSEAQEELMQLQTQVHDEATGVAAQPVKSPPLVKKMLSFLVKGTTSRINCVVASYGVSLLTKEDLHDMTWEVIGNLETCGIRVCALICDGSPINRGFFDMQASFSGDAGVVYDTVNIFAPDRLIYFISDPPHLLKTIRNCLYNSGKKKCRNLKIGGENLHWDTIVRLFKWKSEKTVKELYKLTAPCVFLNSYSRMKVAFAARVLSDSVANALDKLKWPGTEQLSLFEEM